MKAPASAKELLLQYLQHINDADKVIELFSEDATIELPYLQSLGMPWQWVGKDTLLAFLKNLPTMFPGFEFQNIQVYIDTPDQVFGEYDVDCTVASTGLPYRQSYMGRLVAADGKIKLIREALNTFEAYKSMFPNEHSATVNH